MSVKLLSGTCAGMESSIIEVEVNITKGLPSFCIVGLADVAVKESRQRVRSAIINSGYKFPLGRITVNLAPANIRKVGSMLDLPIALAILMESGQINEVNYDKFVIFGELSLEGKIRGVVGALSIILEGRDNNINSFIMPYENVNECIYNKEADYFPFLKLEEVTSFINNNDKLPYEINNINLSDEEFECDFSDIIGQQQAKRALMISVAGGHNIMLFGSTGVGKSLLAKSVRSIMPDLSFDEEINVAKTYSVMNILKKNKKVSRPFRMPHHSITKTALLGGGKRVSLGEVSLANKGVLYFDELLEFKREVLESLREPLEEKSITISRLDKVRNIESDFLFIASTNLCPCGKSDLGYNSDNKCKCTYFEKKRYLNKMSNALKDRIDLFVYVPKIPYEEIKYNNSENESKKVKKAIILAQDIQKERYKKINKKLNSSLKGKEILKYININKNAKKIMEEYLLKSKASLRAYGKILKISRTIADLENSDKVLEEHIIESLSYRKNFDGEII